MAVYEILNIETKVNNHNLQNTKGLDYHYQIRHTCTFLFIYLKKKRKKVWMTAAGIYIFSLITNSIWTSCAFYWYTGF